MLISKSNFYDLLEEEIKNVYELSEGTLSYDLCIYFVKG